MAKAAHTVDYANPFTFMGLMASEGKIPGVVSGSADKQFLMVALSDGAVELASDLTAKGDFFMLMTDVGMMKAEEIQAKKAGKFRIVRPRGLGGDFGFGGGALAH